MVQASDILSDGTQDPTQTGDGISIGLGFNATVVQLGPWQHLLRRRPTPAPTLVCSSTRPGESGGGPA
jgi:hypothetical protein